MAKGIKIHIDANEEKLKDIGENLETKLVEYKRLRKIIQDGRSTDKLIGKFKELAAKTTKVGQKLGLYEPPDVIQPASYFKDGKGENASYLFFCGYLEGDYSLKANLPMNLSGGFFLKTPSISVLLDPGNGTRAGLRDMGIDINKVDIIIVTHYHKHVRRDLHAILTDIMYQDVGESWRNKKIFLSTEAAIEGRGIPVGGDNNYSRSPSIMDPAYLDVLEPHVVKPDQNFYIRKVDGKCVMEHWNKAEAPPKPEDDSILIRTFPAYHYEIYGQGEKKDEDSLQGKCVSSYFLQTSDVGVYFSGDTGFDDSYKGRLKGIKDDVDILVANVKTIQHGDKSIPANEDEPDIVKALARTKNQLGFRGTVELADALGFKEDRHKCMVLRAFGLETVSKMVDEHDIIHKPEYLSVYMRMMELLLDPDRKGKKQVIIPGRNVLRIARNVEPEHKIMNKVIVPSITHYDILKIGKPGDMFVSSDKELIQDINFYESILLHNDRPFIVIQGVTGSGKTTLARALAWEILNKDPLSKIAGIEEKDIITELEVSTPSGKKKHATSDTAIQKKWDEQGKKQKPDIHIFDLATVAKDDADFWKRIVGWPPCHHFPEDKGFRGMLDRNGVLIMNQLESMPTMESQKFLDIITEWKFAPLDKEKKRDLGLRIIFTTSQDIDQCPTLLPEFKNRVRDRVIVIPYIEELPPDIREKELSLFVDDWCRKEGVILDGSGWEKVLALDLRNGALRCLNGVLSKARQLAKNEYGLLDHIKSNKAKTKMAGMVFVSGRFVEKAMEDNGVGLRKNNRQSNDKMKITRGLICLMAIFISDSCKCGITSNSIRGGMGKSSQWFKKARAEFRGLFKTNSKTEAAEKAWAFFALENVRILEEKETFIEYIDTLSGEKGGGGFMAYFTEGENQKWLKDKYEKFKINIKDENVKKRFCGMIEKA